MACKIFHAVWMALCVVLTLAESQCGTGESCEADEINFLQLKIEDSIPGTHMHPGRAVQEVMHVDVSELTPELFHQRYVKRNLAVIVHGAAGNIFSDIPSWSVRGLLSSPHASTKQRCMLTGASLNWRELSEGNWSADSIHTGIEMMDLHELVAYPKRAVLFRTVPFKLLWPEAAYWDAPMSLQRQYFQKLRERNVLQHANASRMEPSFFNLHLSNQGGAMPHFHSAVINVLFQGSKKWILIDPLQVDSGFHSFLQMSQSTFQTSQEWFGNPDVRKWLSRNPHYEFTLREGDGLFIPEGWVHATVDLTRITLGAILKSQVVHNGFEFSMSDEPGHSRIEHEPVALQYANKWWTTAN